jgi:hypothetical protein
MKPNHIARCTLAAVCAIAASGACAASGALAADGIIDLRVAQIEPVGDDVLAHQTGKYAGANMISGFVLNLLSQWQLPNGAIAFAAGTLSVANDKLNQVSAQVNAITGVHDPLGTTSHGSSGNKVSGGDAVSVNGVSQVTQVAGNNNLGSNSAQIDFNTPSSPQSFNNAVSSMSSNANGNIKAGISFGQNGITLAIQTPTGLATQTIAPTSTQQAGAIAQLLQIAGNNQQVANRLQLHLLTQQMTASQLRQIGIQQALQNMTSLRK